MATKKATRRIEEDEAPMGVNLVPERTSKLSPMDAALYLKQYAEFLAQEIGTTPEHLNRTAAKLMIQERKARRSMSRIASGM